jgi:DNA-binding response OmpR family regulator
MLVIDDFNELVGLETLFRRLGFDVLSLGRESLVSEAVLGFPPDLAVATGVGRHVHGLTLAPKLRYGSSQPKLVVLLPYRDPDLGSHPGLLNADVDAVIETPFDPRAALRVVAQLLNLDPEPLLEKYTKIVTARLFEPLELKIIKHQVEPLPLIHVTSSEEFRIPGKSGAFDDPGEVPVFKRPESAREARYAKFLDDKAEEELPPMVSADFLRDAQKKQEDADAKATMEEIQRAAKLAREKREFVRAMLEAAEPEPTGEAVRSLSDEAPAATKKK